TPSPTPSSIRRCHRSGNRHCTNPSTARTGTRHAAPWLLPRGFPSAPHRKALRNATEFSRPARRSARRSGPPVSRKNQSLRCSLAGCCCAGDCARPADLLLQLDQPVNQCLRRGWTARNVYINRYYAVATAHYRIGIVIVTAAVRAGSHRDDPPGFRHLVVNLAERRSHLVHERSSHDHDVRLSGTRAEDDAETVKVVTRSTCMHHLDCAAGEAECQRPKGARSGPLDDIVDTRDDETFFLQARGLGGHRGRRGGRGIVPCFRSCSAQSHTNAPFFRS